MSRKTLRLGAGLIGLFLLVTPLFSRGALESNVTAGSVDTYNKNLDYFPDKVALKEAEHFTVEYHNNFKVVNVLDPWEGAEVKFQYLLVQRGTPIPEGYPDARVVEVPIRSVVTMSTTYLAYLDMLGQVDRLIGHDMLATVSTQSVRQMIAEGKVKEVGTGQKTNVELLLAMEPELIVAYGMGNETDVHPKLLEAGLTVAMNAEFMERTPLGRSEWLKFLALFFNMEKVATDVFEGMRKRYINLTEKARSASDKPTVFCNNFSWGAWWMPGGTGFMATLLADAGADYLWKETDQSGSLQLSFESVYEKAFEADYWINVGYMIDAKDDLISQDERYTGFKAFSEGRLYNNTARVNESGGDDFWESGLAKPDIVLADLVKIFHPEMVPDHELYFYKKIE